jgi:Endonuclease IV
VTKFGPSGNSASFYKEGHSSTKEAAKWCRERGLDLFEYSLGQGINISENSAREIGSEFKKEGVEMSVHAPYFTNFSNPDPVMAGKSVGYVLASLKRAEAFQAERVVVHPASQGAATREEAMRVARENFLKLKDAIIERGYQNKLICIETLGKTGQMGTVDEIISLASLADFFYPCIDFGHVNAREQGILKNTLNYNTLIHRLLDNLPRKKVENMHVHFSKIKFGPKGELVHLTFADTVYGPPFEPLAEALVRFNLDPYVVCESDGTQAEDATFMKEYYFKVMNRI